MATAPEERVIYALDVDEQSITRTVAGVGKGEKAVDSFTNKLERTGPVAQRIGRQVSDSMGNVGNSGAGLRDVENNFDRLRQAAEEYWESLDKVDDKQKSVAKGGSGGGVLGSVDRISSVGTQILGGLGNGEAANAAGLLGDVAGAFTSLNPIMLATTAVGVGAAAIFSEIGRQLEEAKKKGADYLQQQTQVTDFIAGGATSEDIKQRISGIEAQRQGLLETSYILEDFETLYRGLQAMKDRQETVAQFEHNKALEAQLNAELAAATGGYLTNQQQLEQAILQTDEAIAATTGPLALLNLALDSSAVAGNNAAAAAEEQAKANRDLANEQIRFIDQTLSIDNMTREQREKRARDIEREIELLQGQIDAGNANDEAVEQLTERILNLNGEYLELTSSTETYADVLNREKTEKELLNKQYDNYLDALREEGKIRDQITALRNEEAKAAETSAAEVKKIRDKAEADSAAALTEFNDGRTEAETKDRKEREKALDSHLKNLKRINDRYQQDSLNAIANRDAVAFDQAKIQAETDKALEEESYQERLDQLDESLQAQYKLLDDRLKKSQQRIEQAARQAIATEDARYQAEQRQRENAYRRLENDLINTLINQENIARNGSGGLLRIHTDLWNSLNILSAQGAALLQQQFAQQFNTAGSAAQGYRYAGVTNSFEARMVGGGGFDEGGYNLLPGIYESKVPELHIPFADVNRFLDGELQLPAPLQQKLGLGSRGATIISYNDLKVEYSIDMGMSVTQMKGVVWDVFEEALLAVQRRRGA